jgi:hypothetical protein
MPDEGQVEEINEDGTFYKISAGGSTYTSATPQTGFSEVEGHLTIAFNAYGESVLLRQWSKYDTQAVADPVTFKRIGNDSQPASNLPSAPYTFDPSRPTVSTSNTEGWHVTATQTVWLPNMEFTAD